MPDEVKTAIQENVTGPKSMSNDTGSATQHDVAQQIEADRYLDSKTAATKKGFGLRFMRLKAPGADDV